MIQSLSSFPKPSPKEKKVMIKKQKETKVKIKKEENLLHSHNRVNLIKKDQKKKDKKLKNTNKNALNTKPSCQEQERQK